MKGEWSGKRAREGGRIIASILDCLRGQSVSHSKLQFAVGFAAASINRRHVMAQFPAKLNHAKKTGSRLCDLAEQGLAAPSLDYTPRSRNLPALSLSVFFY